jgi:hypothetical protein
MGIEKISEKDRCSIYLYGWILPTPNPSSTIMSEIEVINFMFIILVHMEYMTIKVFRVYPSERENVPNRKIYI